MVLDMSKVAEISPSSTKLQDRIKGYLSMGGLFNPELVNHDIVRDLILDERAELLTQKRKPLSPQVIGDLLEPYGDFNSYDYKQGFVDGVLCAEKAHGITGVDDE